MRGRETARLQEHESPVEKRVIGLVGAKEPLECPDPETDRSPVAGQRAVEGVDAAVVGVDAAVVGVAAPEGPLVRDAKVAHVVRDDGALLHCRRSEDCPVGLLLELRAIPFHGHDVMASLPEFTRYAPADHRVEEQLHEASAASRFRCVTGAVAGMGSVRNR